MKMNYNRYQVMAAAQFIWNHNPSVEEWPTQPRSVLDIFEDILAFGRRIGMQNMADQDNWAGWSGTGGYVMLITSDDDDSFTIDVYVDPSVGIDGRYVEEFIDEDDYDEQ